MFSAPQSAWKLVGPFGGKFAQRDALGQRLADCFVVHISDVARVHHLDAIDFEHAAQHILNQEGPEIADVRRPVNGGPAAVEPEALPRLRRQRLNGAAARVVEMDRHVRSVKAQVKGPCKRKRPEERKRPEARSGDQREP